jgi:hypothetical protein
MSSITHSFFVQYKHDPVTGCAQLEVVQIENAKEVRLRDGSFLVRIVVDESTAVQRCFIRHIASGREVYVQGGPNLGSFIQACLLNDSVTEVLQQYLTNENDTSP